MFQHITQTPRGKMLPFRRTFSENVAPPAALNSAACIHIPNRRPPKEDQTNIRAKKIEPAISRRLLSEGEKGARSPPDLVFD
jgi:hypothetical protein